MDTALHPKLLSRLACPIHRTSLAERDNKLCCEFGHNYPIVCGVPVLLDEGPKTLWVAERSLQRARCPVSNDPYHLDTLGISDREREQLREQLPGSQSPVDPVVAYLVTATNGIAYKGLVGNLPEYPIPSLRLPVATHHNHTLLDIGCNWGRWCIAAAHKGYVPIGIDPSLGAVFAAKRLADQLGVEAYFVVGDARTLPFAAGTLDVAFSYSVIQHFSRKDAAAAIQEIGRVLKPNGISLVQLPMAAGVRCLYHQARRRFREGSGFEVRYWSIPSVRDLFSAAVGPTKFTVDCFFGIGLQYSDIRLMPPLYRMVARMSEVLRKTSSVVTPLTYVADSIYVHSEKRFAELLPRP